MCCLVAKSCLTPLPPPWTVAHQALLSMEFPRQEYWSGLPFPSPGDFLDPGIELHLLYWQADALLLSHQGSPILVLYRPQNNYLKLTLNYRSNS